jgi:hypothetical protein
MPVLRCLGSIDSVRRNCSWEASHKNDDVQGAWRLVRYATLGRDLARNGRAHDESYPRQAPRCCRIDGSKRR